MPIEIGENCELDNLKFERYKTVKIGDDVTIGNDVIFDVLEMLIIGDRTSIGGGTRISGRHVEIGRECWIDKNVYIGGGSCYEKSSKLIMGDWVHVGRYAEINTAREVIIEDEVGIGEFSRIYTHGAYQSHFEGFPVDWGSVKIKRNSWIPNAIILPNVEVGENVVIGAGAVVNKNIPPGCLAAGVPARIVKENCYPYEYTSAERANLVRDFVQHFRDNILTEIERNETWFVLEGSKVWVDDAIFDLKGRTIIGAATEITERFRNELRRWGHRFRYYAKDGEYVKW